MIATGTYFAFRDDVFTRLIDRQTKISSEDLADLRAQIDRLTSQQVLDKEQVEQKLKAFLQKQATFEQSTSAFTDDLSTQNGWPTSGTINSLPLLSPIEKPSAPIVAIPNAEPAKQAEQAVTVDRKARRPHRRHARVIPRTQQEAPNPVAAEPVQTGQQNYY